jgi:DNA-binding NarL/FixJ family response regulator
VATWGIDPVATLVGAGFEQMTVRVARHLLELAARAPDGRATVAVTHRGSPPRWARRVAGTGRLRATSAPRDAGDHRSGPPLRLATPPLGSDHLLALAVVWPDGETVAPVTRRSLAEAVGTAREVVTRALRELGQLGLVSTSPGHAVLTRGTGAAGDGRPAAHGSRCRRRRPGEPRPGPRRELSHRRGDCRHPRRRGRDGMLIVWSGRVVSGWRPSIRGVRDMDEVRAVSRIRVLLVEDHRGADGARQVLDATPDIEMVAVVTDAADEAVAAARAHVPEVVVMDHTFCDDLAAETAARIREALPQVGIVLMCESDDVTGLWSALTAGCAGYLVRPGDLHSLAETVRAVAAGETVISSRHLSRLFPGGRTPYSESRLTLRERDLLRLSARGLSDRAIAERMLVGIDTVRTHVQGILAKLGARSPTEAVAIAQSRGLLDGSP